MKKNYVKPAMLVVEMAVQQMLAASGDKATGISGNVNWNWGGGSNGGGRSRESDDWDDE
jgi:hypothetical protein